MKLISLSLRQWRTFERCDIEFPDGLIGIRGPNGAGKTTLAEAIGWALFGKIRAGGRIDELRRQDAPRGELSSVELVFRLGPTLFRVERVVRGTAKLWIGGSTTPETTQTLATNARVARELDMNWDVFHRTVFARQKDVAALDPAGSRDARRRHVERLLGLERYRIGAEKARGDARSIADELTGRRADAPDLSAVEAELAAVEEQAAEDDPRVEKAAAAADDARQRYDALVAAVDGEAERARQSVGLEAERKRQTEVAEEAEREATRLQSVLDQRAQKIARVNEIREDAAAAPDAARQAKLWDDLAEAIRELNAAESLLATLEYDAEADEDTRTRAAALTAERASAGERQAALAPEHASLQQRVAALEAAASAGAVEAASAALQAAREQQQTTRGRLEIERHELQEDQAHVAAVAEGGGDTPCPVCLRPYGAEHETILAKYRTRIADREAEIMALERHGAALAGQVEQFEAALRASERAADGLAVTKGPNDAAAAAEQLGRTEAELDELAARLAAIDDDLQTLTEAARTIADAREKWSAQEAIRTDRAARAARLLEELGVPAYDAERDAAVHADFKRVTRLAAESVELSRDVASTDEAEEQRTQAEARAAAARAAEAAARTAIEALAFDPERLPLLREQRDAAQTATDQATNELAEARATAQAQSEAVRTLRARLDEARRILAAIGERSLELERHRIAAELLTAFRNHQSQRAWPHLEQGASAILSAATDGRYADVRLSDHFRIVVVDRGEEHELSRFSGGEQDVTNLCLRLAIAEWVARERGAEINFVVLDEVFGSQDDERRQLLLGELRALGNRFQQLLVITHLSDIADLCEHQIEVRLEEPGRSTTNLLGP